MKWLIEVDLKADLSDDEIVEEIRMTYIDDSEIVLTASLPLFTVSCADAVATLTTYSQGHGVDMQEIVRKNQNIYLIILRSCLTCLKSCFRSIFTLNKKSIFLLNVLF